MRNNEGWCLKIELLAKQEKRSWLTNYEVMPMAANSFLISSSVSIFLSCVTSSLSPRFCLSFNSSIALSCQGR